jgi:hypothetical protein
MFHAGWYIVPAVLVKVTKLSSCTVWVIVKKLPASKVLVMKIT